MIRWLKFSAVGIIGIPVQLAVLAILRSALGVPYLAATALAVEAAVLHNFLWHERWTWRDRTVSARGVWRRLASFNVTTGLVSMVTNLAFMRLLVGQFHLQYLLANLLSIAAGAVANFLLSDRCVFAGRPEERAAHAMGGSK